MVFQNEQVQSTNYPRRFKSPFFSLANSSSITTGTEYLFDYHQDLTDSQKYNSFNNLSIANNGSNDIVVYPNQDKSNGGIFIPAGTIRELDQRIFPSTTSLLVENVDAGTISANQIRITFWKDLTEIQSQASRLHERLFSSEPNPFIQDFSSVLLRLRGKE